MKVQPINSSKSRIDVWIGAALLVITMLVFGVAVALQQSQTKKVQVRLNDSVYTATVVQKEAERQRGLSGVEKLGAAEGMLFIFDYEDRYGIWMKEMNFPIDVIWFDDNLKIVHIVERMMPESYPKTYVTDTPARYVLELPAGSVDHARVSMGDTMVINR